MAGSPRGQSGQVLVLVAVAILALVGITALALLAGSAAWNRNQLQSLADSAALDAAMKIGIGCSAGAASTVIGEADSFLATQRTRAGSLSTAAGTCATPYHGTDTFTGGLTADYYYPYQAHQQQVEVVLTLSLPISFGSVAGRSTTTVSRYAVAQALPGSVAAISATTLSCTGGQVNVNGDITAQNAITLSGGCAIYAHQRASSGSYSALGNIRDYTDGQAWSSGGSCVAGATSGSSSALCADGYELAGHQAPACGTTTEYLSAPNATVNANPCAAGVDRAPVAPRSTTLPPDPNTDPAAIATLQGTGGAACSAAGVYANIVAGGTTWGTGQAPAPTKDASGYWHFKPSCYGYLTFASAAGGISSRQTGVESAPNKHFITATIPAASIAGTFLLATVHSESTPNKFAAPAGWISAAEMNDATVGRTEIWYYPNNPGGITSVVFTINPANINAEAQLSEWTGVMAAAPLDQTGTQDVTVATTTTTISTTAATTQPDELVVTAHGFSTTAVSYARGAGWNAMAADTTVGYAADYRLDLGAGVASETATAGVATAWADVIAAFKPAAGSSGAVLDPGFYYFNGSGFAGGGGICLNGGTLLARDVTIEFVNQAGLSSGNCLAGGATVCAVATCAFGADPAGGLVDGAYTWFAAPCSQDPNSGPDASCLGASSWCPAGDRSCWNLLVYQPSAATGQVALKGTSVKHWILGSVFWPGTFTDVVNGTSTLAGAVASGTLSISATAGAGTAVGSDYGVSTATVEAVLVE